MFLDEMASTWRFVSFWDRAFMIFAVVMAPFFLVTDLAYGILWVAFALQTYLVFWYRKFTAELLDLLR